MRILSSLLFWGILSAGASALASPLDASYRGSLGLEGRAYEDDDQEQTKDSQFSVKGVLAAEVNKGRYEGKLGLIFRDAYLDQSRDFFALTDTYVGAYFGDWNFSAGTQVYNWRILDIFTSVDYVNAVNYDNTDEIERIGLPSVSIVKEFESSFFQAIYIPRSLPSSFTQETNRQGIGVELDEPEFVTGDFKSAQGDAIFQYILRYKKSFNNLELDLHYSRKFDTFYPIIAIDIPKTLTIDLNKLDIRPYYFPSRQSALSLQSNFGEWIGKLEASYVDFDDYLVASYLPPADVIHIKQTDHTKVSGGLEKTFQFENNHAGTVYLEYTHVFTEHQDEAALLGAFTRDAGLAYRHAVNDFKSNVLSFLVIHDTLTGDETLWRAGHEFRPIPAWKISTVLTVIDAPKPDLSDPLDLIYGLKPIRESDNILLTISRFF